MHNTFSGAQNVISGNYGATPKANPELKLSGFLMGPDGIIDGDIRVQYARDKALCAMSFGFHTDASSDVKYWHVCKAMGRVASHLALEVTLQTHAKMTKKRELMIRLRI